MEVYALKLSFNDDDVTCYVLKRLKMPAELLFFGGIVPFERISLAEDLLTMSLSQRFYTPALSTLFLDKMSADELGSPGILVSRKSQSAMNYLLAHWLIQGAGELEQDIVNARLQKDRGESFHSTLKKYVHERKETSLFESVEPITDFQPIVPAELFKNLFTEVSQDVWMMSTSAIPEGFQVGALLEKPVSTQQRKLKMYDALVVCGDASERRVICSTDGFWRSMDVGEDVLPEPVRKYSSRGRMVAFDNGDLTALNTWRVLMLVRVPSDRTLLGSEERPACLEGIPGARVLDARVPVPRSSLLSVVDDPQEAIDILCRYSRGFLLPGLGSARLPSQLGKYRGRYMSVCVPAPWV
ncbi:MAG TPA: hypothetical protein PKK50_05640 [Myxococcota bacterium]|nr:hypothetical protein [Myxococcota bacterium]HNZ03605.1 hypothetical protein [Myxococcota bacterium]